MQVKAKKSLGQNFLNDKNIIQKIVNSNKISSEDLVIEIGPGMGALTKQLKNYNAQLICYEIDERMKPILRELEDEKTKIIFSDFLKANINADLKDYDYKNLFVIGNLPYYITTPIIEKVINSKLDISSLTIMVQNEVADRFSAKPKNRDYSSITVYLNYYFDVEKLFVVKNTCFSPVPKVDSAVIKLSKKHKKYEVINEKLFLKLIHDSFKYKRKTLKNNLNNYNWIDIETILLKNNYSEKVRAEEIDIETYVEISNYLSEK